MAKYTVEYQANTDRFVVLDGERVVDFCTSEDEAMLIAGTLNEYHDYIVEPDYITE